jgi:hypothetical protein
MMRERTNNELHEAMYIAKSTGLWHEATLSTSEKSSDEGAQMFLSTLKEQASYHVPWLLIALGLGGIWWVLCGVVL